MVIRKPGLGQQNFFTTTAQERWEMEELDPGILSCKGCRSGGELHSGYGYCPIRECAQKRSLTSCGLCPEWEDCNLLVNLFSDESKARENLKKIAGKSDK